MAVNSICGHTRRRNGGERFERVMTERVGRCSVLARETWLPPP
jgi:hypothetical protein